MKSSLIGSALGALVLSVPIALAADIVTDQSFNQETRAITKGLELQHEQGVFGRAGSSALSEEGQAAPRSVGDREIDRYVQRLGYQLRLYNERASRDPSGFQ